MPIKYKGKVIQQILQIFLQNHIEIFLLELLLEFCKLFRELLKLSKMIGLVREYKF